MNIINVHYSTESFWSHFVHSQTGSNCGYASVEHTGTYPASPRTAYCNINRIRVCRSIATHAIRSCPLSGLSVRSGRKAGTAIAEQGMRKGRCPRRIQDVPAGDCPGDPGNPVTAPVAPGRIDPVPRPQVLSHGVLDRVMPGGRGMIQKASRQRVGNRIVRHGVPDPAGGHDLATA